MSRMSRSSVMLKKEIKMSFLKDVFQIADEIKQNQEKFKSAVETSFHLISQNKAFEQRFFMGRRIPTGAWSGKMAGLCALLL